MVSLKSTQSGPVWANDRYNWCAPEGIARLQSLLQGKVPYEVAERQLIATARLLMGQHGLYVWATGEGKSSVFYLYSFVRPQAMTVVVAPTNALEDDLVKRLTRLGLHALAINQDALIAAGSTAPPRDLWAEVKGGTINILLLSPEMLLSARFKDAIRHENVRPRLAIFSVDEVHLVDEWGLNFRKAYGRIADTIPWLPTWTTRAGLTATLEPGRQTQAIETALGFHDGNFALDRRDCERHNIDVVLRPVQYAYTTDEFLDLDWVIPSGMTAATDVAKTLIYCETIDLGHRLAVYLRKRLPPNLWNQRNTIIRHAHSLNCPRCKTEILDSLYQTGDARMTAIVIATDVLGVGMDVPDCDVVICFPTPSCTSSLIQRIGRASRARDRHGTAYIYLKKTDIEAVSFYIQTQTDLDTRFLASTFAIKHSASTLPIDTIVTPKAPPKKIAVRVKSDIFIKNLSLWAIVAAYVRNICVVRQINVIQGNPGIDHNCGRCSSCTPGLHPIPPSRSIVPTIPAMSTPSLAEHSCSGQELAGYLKLKAIDVERLKRQLAAAAFKVCDEGPESDDDLLIGYRGFLDSRWISKIIDRFMLITSKEVLKARLEGWEYWDVYGDALWHEVEKLIEATRVELEQRRADSLQNRREKQQLKVQEEAKVRAENAAAGLGQVKKVTLRLRPPPVASTHSTEKENPSRTAVRFEPDFAVADVANSLSPSIPSTPPASPKRRLPLNNDLTNMPRKKKRSSA